jgi:Nucleotidyl transferase AbiEii toxin, Type IV TA system
LSNEAEAVLHIVREISQMPMDDGLTYDSGMADADIIRDEDQYSGVRVSLSGSLARARFTLHIDVNIGDPIWPAPSTIALPRLLGGQIVITGYPLAMVHAEKIVTAVERATANTRWRDFADIYLLSRKHPATGNELIRAITTVAEHRKAALLPLATTLRDFPPLAQNRWFAWRRQQDLAGAPADFADLLTAVIAFADPAITGGAKDKNWDAATSIWH